jgi:hypothetical protein
MVPAQQREFRADLIAARIIAESAPYLDAVPPNIALGGALLGMKIHEVVDDGLRVLGRPPTRSTTHPPFSLRADAVHGQYMSDFGENIATDPSLSSEAIIPPARTLEQIWAKVRPRLEADARRGRALHPIWTQRT